MNISHLEPYIHGTHRILAEIQDSAQPVLLSLVNIEPSILIEGGLSGGIQEIERRNEVYVGWREPSDSSLSVSPAGLSTRGPTKVLNGSSYKEIGLAVQTVENPFYRKGVSDHCFDTFVERLTSIRWKGLSQRTPPDRSRNFWRHFEEAGSPIPHTGCQGPARNKGGRKNVELIFGKFVLDCLPGSEDKLTLSGKLITDSTSVNANVSRWMGL
jgi:hypothetical protein